MIIFNPLTTPVVYSDEGHILGGGERIEVDKLDKHGERAVAHGYLVILDEEKTEDEPAPREEEEAPEEEVSTARSGGRGRQAKAKAKSEDSGASTGSDGD